MSLRELVKPTPVAVPGMSVSELFAECIRVQVPGLPYCDESGEMVGKASIRHVLKLNCMPDYVVQHSHLLGNSIDHMQFRDSSYEAMMRSRIDDFVVKDFASIGIDAPVSKALARMEQHDTTYIFVRDNGDYLGAITIISIAAFISAEAANA